MITRASAFGLSVAAGIAALSAPGCRDVSVDGFPVSVGNNCPEGFTPVSGRCYRSPPQAPVDVGDGSSGDASSSAGSADTSMGAEAGAPSSMDGPPQPSVDASLSSSPDADGRDATRPGDTGMAEAAPCPASGCWLKATRLDAGRDLTCAVLPDQSVRCWGANRPPTMPALSAVSAVATGWGHQCALGSDALVRCWGSNGSGELGGTPVSPGTPVMVAMLGGVLEIDAGAGYTCARVTGGAVRCWGGNSSGQLGVDSATVESSSTPLLVPGLMGATVLNVGTGRACVIVAGGTVRCWPGDGTTFDASGLVTLPGISGATAVAVGRDHACAVVRGTVQCWGYNVVGQLGNGSVDPGPLPPGPVLELSGVMAIAAGTAHTCALISGGSVRCWGSNGSGQLGDAATENSARPVTVRGLSSAVTAVVAGDSHTCAIASDGVVFCWGDNGAGQVGNTSFGPTRMPVMVSAR